MILTAVLRCLLAELFQLHKDRIFVYMVAAPKVDTDDIITAIWFKMYVVCIKWLPLNFIYISRQFRPLQKKSDEDDLPAEYLASPLAQQSQVSILFVDTIVWKAYKTLRGLRVSWTYSSRTSETCSGHVDLWSTTIAMESLTMTHHLYISHLWCKHS